MPQWSGHARELVSCPFRRALKKAGRCQFYTERHGRMRLLAKVENGRRRRFWPRWASRPSCPAAHEGSAVALDPVDPPAPTSPVPEGAMIQALPLLVVLGLAPQGAAGQSPPPSAPKAAARAPAPKAVGTTAAARKPLARPKPPTTLDVTVRHRAESPWRARSSSSRAGWRSTPARRTGRTAADGRVKVDGLSRPPWDVAVQARGLAPKRVARVAGDTPLVVRLDPGAVVTGVVRDGVTRDPVAGARVWTSVRSGGAAPDRWDPGRRPRRHDERRAGPLPPRRPGAVAGHDRRRGARPREGEPPGRPPRRERRAVPPPRGDRLRHGPRRGRAPRPEGGRARDRRSQSLSSVPQSPKKAGPSDPSLALSDPSRAR